jgi:hypothetical protein
MRKNERNGPGITTSALGAGGSFGSDAVIPAATIASSAGCLGPVAARQGVGKDKVSEVARATTARRKEHFMAGLGQQQVAKIPQMADKRKPFSRSQKKSPQEDLKKNPRPMR